MGWQQPKTHDVVRDCAGASTPNFLYLLFGKFSQPVKSTIINERVISYQSRKLRAAELNYKTPPSAATATLAEAVVCQAVPEDEKKAARPPHRPAGKEGQKPCKGLLRLERSPESVRNSDFPTIIPVPDVWLVSKFVHRWNQLRQGTRALKTSQVYPQGYGKEVARLHLQHVATWHALINSGSVTAVFFANGLEQLAASHTAVLPKARNAGELKAQMRVLLPQQRAAAEMRKLIKEATVFYNEHVPLGPTVAHNACCAGSINPLRPTGACELAASERVPQGAA